jgi:hypothetical protein
MMALMQIGAFSFLFPYFLWITFPGICEGLKMANGVLTGGLTLPSESIQTL